MGKPDWHSRVVGDLSLTRRLDGNNRKIGAGRQWFFRCDYSRRSKQRKNKMFHNQLLILIYASN